MSACVALLAPAAAEETKAADAATPLVVVVMDPLALPLSCPCVKGYAQRDYQKLADALEAQLGRTVSLVFNESLSAALRDQTDGKADLVIGKHSVVLADCAKNKLAATPLAMLSGKDGSTTQTGLIVVPADDPAQNGRRPPRFSDHFWTCRVRRETGCGPGPAQEARHHPSGKAGNVGSVQ